MRKLNGETFIHNGFRYISLILVQKVLIHTSITPNQITIFRNLLLLTSFICFLQINYLYFLGFLLFQIFELLDSVDGDLARYKNLRSKLGVWLEIFFDAIFTPVWGMIGCLFAYISYKIDGNLIYFLFWAFIGFSVNLENTYYIHFKGCKNELEDAQHGHVYFGFRNESFLTKIRNFIIVSKCWENQWLVFGGLIYVCLQINLFLYIWIWLLLLNQIHWIRLAIYGYKKAIK